MNEIEFLTAVRDALLPDQGEQPRAGFAEVQRALNDALKQEADKRWHGINFYATVRRGP